MTIFVNEKIHLEENEISLEFVRASGPGGQNVNKVATAVKLYFALARSPSLPEPVRRRLRQIAGKKVNSQGILVMDARRFRTQEQNRRDAVERLVGMIRKAAVPPRPRIATRPTGSSKERRIEAKKKLGKIKRTRQNPRFNPD